MSSTLSGVPRRHLGVAFLLGGMLAAVGGRAEARSQISLSDAPVGLSGQPILDRLGLAMIDYMWRTPGATPLGCARAALRALATSQFQLDLLAARFLTAPEARLGLVPQALSRVMTATGPVQRAGAYNELQSILLVKAHALADAASWWLPLEGAGLIGLDYVDQLLHLDANAMANDSVEFASLPSGRRRVMVRHQMKRAEDRSSGGRRTVFALPVEDLEKAAMAFRDRAIAQAYMQVEIDADLICRGSKQALKNLRLRATQLAIVHADDEVLLNWQLGTEQTRGCVPGSRARP